MRPRTREGGFSLVEMVVVVAIIAILMAMVVMKMTGTKRTTYYRVASASAVSYADAVEAYMADNGQAPPALGSSGWPSGTRDDRIRGPLNVMLVQAGRPKPYMSKAAPEPVSDGIVDIGTSKASMAPGTRAFITYTITGDEYRFTVETIPVDSSEPVLTCIVSNSASTPAGVQRCG